jgi:hypothetical protein
MTVQSVQNVHVLRQFAKEREAALRRTTLLVGDGHQRRPVRRWIGRQLVLIGAWLANDPTMRPVRAR